MLSPRSWTRKSRSGSKPGSASTDTPSAPAPKRNGSGITIQVIIPPGSRNRDESHQTHQEDVAAGSAVRQRPDTAPVSGPCAPAPHIRPHSVISRGAKKL
jgi:hypothetical protein